MDDSQTELPPLGRDVAFWGMTITQFLGAFNDNVFKQLLLMIGVSYLRQQNQQDQVGDPYQAIALALFAAAFVLFSGFAGYLSDKFSKRKFVVICKVAEIVVMLAGMAAFWFGAANSLTLIVLLSIVLFFMGVQSAFFGPSKYGILPELFRNSDLPQANGIIQMTTFLAIILGTALAGFLKVRFEDQRWVISMICVGIAVTGTLTSLLIRKTRVANPELKFSLDCLLIEKSTWHELRKDGILIFSIVVYTLFWFVGAVVLPLVNNVCMTQLHYGDGTTSCMAACLAIGIACGCVTCGKLSKNIIRFDLVRIGAVGVVVALGIVALTCLWAPEPVAAAAGANPGNGNPGKVMKLDPQAELLHAALHGSGLVLTGFFAGLFVVPLQVFIQTRPPESMRGRVIAASALSTWVGILVAAGYYWWMTYLFPPGQLHWAYIAAGFLLLLVPLFLRHPNLSANDAARASGTDL